MTMTTEPTAASQPAEVPTSVPAEITRATHCSCGRTAVEVLDGG